MGEKQDLDTEKDIYNLEKTNDAGSVVNLDEEQEENSRIEAVRLVVPVTDNLDLVCITFRFWILSLFFSIIGSVIYQYYYFRVASGTFSIYFVNLASYALGTGMAKYLPTRKFTIGGYSMSLNPGPFNIKEHAVIGIAVSTAATSAYAIDILTVTDLFLKHRINTLGAFILILTTQCLGYGMAGFLRKYLVYPAEMVWWSNLVHVVFYNAMHNTDEFKTKKMIRGWSYMKYFWIFCGGMFLWEFVPQFLAPMLGFFSWICWIAPFDFNMWGIFSTYYGGGVLGLSFDWTSIGGSTMWLPLSAQLCSYGGVIVSYWIMLPIFWVLNIWDMKKFGRPLTPRLYFSNGTRFYVQDFLNDDFSLNEDLYEAAGDKAMMTPLYALGFFFSFVALAACISHVIVFNGHTILKSWRTAVGHKDEDIHTKMMRVYPEIPQLWYAGFYVIMLGLSMMVCEVYGLQLPWWGMIVACALAWILTLPICTMTAITGYGPGLNVITELVCGYMLPGKPIANMAFKCYGYMAMSQCMTLLSDLKLGHYMKIPPRAMFVSQLWGTVVGGIFNYITMIAIIDAQRPYLDGTQDDPAGLWTGAGPNIFWGSAQIFGALGPQRMFNSDGQYGYAYYGFLIGAVLPIILWALSKKWPNVPWHKVNVSIIAGGMGGFPNGFVTGVTGSVIVCLVWQFWLYRYHKNWWSKYTFILSAALDTGAAFTGLFLFVFISGGISDKLRFDAPSWWGNYVFPDGNGKFFGIDRCGSSGNWTGGRP
ncbi:MAG: OPT oligopeptide transporter protein-domain-containing protein [Linnemannia elongata]|nr:MAG: OPT oligopeptide transporter protein-domain-containing protein [Linnemannia elongata]